MKRCVSFQLAISRIFPTILNELTDELLEFVDEGKIGMRPAVELSYLQEDEMRDLVDFIDDEEVLFGRRKLYE